MNQTYILYTISMIIFYQNSVYLESNVSSIEKDINLRLAKTRTAINRLSIIWKSDLSNEIKHNFFQAAVVSILHHIDAN